MCHLHYVGQNVYNISSGDHKLLRSDKVFGRILSPDHSSGLIDQYCQLMWQNVVHGVIRSQTNHKNKCCQCTFMQSMQSMDVLKLSMLQLYFFPVQFLILSRDKGVFFVWSGLGKKITWYGLGKDE